MAQLQLSNQKLYLLSKRIWSERNSWNKSWMGGVYTFKVPNEMWRKEKQMRTLLVIVLLASSWLIASNAISQESYTETRTKEIAASFNKRKNAVKEKQGIRKDKYKEVRAEPVVKQNASDYSGLYEVRDIGYVINIGVGRDGKVEASGYEPKSAGTQQTRRFRLESARIAGALLTGTKVYEDGAAEKFEGIFINRTEFNSPTDNGISTFGLGVIGNPVEFAGVTLDKLFYQLKR